MTKNVLAQ